MDSAQGRCCASLCTAQIWLTARVSLSWRALKKAFASCMTIMLLKVPALKSPCISVTTDLVLSNIHRSYSRGYYMQEIDSQTCYADIRTLHDKALQHNYLMTEARSSEVNPCTQTTTDCKFETLQQSGSCHLNMNWYN